MEPDTSQDTFTSFLGTGWSFPPAFVKYTESAKEAGHLQMIEGEQDIESSLRILFGTVQGERFFNPKYGLDMHELLFEPASTTMRAFLKDRVKMAILIYEPRINLLALEIDSPDPNEGGLRISIEYEVRATNSRYNLVFPFYKTDSSEVRASAHL